MPIEKITLTGDWDRRGPMTERTFFAKKPKATRKCAGASGGVSNVGLPMNPVEKALYAGERGREKEGRMWRKVPHKVHLFLNNGLGGSLPDVLPNGADLASYSLTTTAQQSAIMNARNTGFVQDDAINVILTHNITISYNPLTPWIIAHRVGHIGGMDGGPASRDSHAVLGLFANANRAYKGVFKPVLSYAPELADIEYEVLTMRSARVRMFDGPHDSIAEIFAQFIINGEITFKPLPDGFEAEGWEPLPDDVRAEFNEKLVETKPEIEARFREWLDASVGHVLVF